MLSPNAIHYTLSHLLRVALPTDNEPDFHFEVKDDTLLLSFANEYMLEMALLTDDEHTGFLEAKASPILIKSADGEIDIPLFSSQRANNTNEMRAVGSKLTIPYDLVTPSFAFLSREEEYGELPRDQHNRFLYSYSLARCYNCIDFPLVDEYAMLLRQWILDFLHPAIYIRPRAFQFIPTHDIDHLYRFKNPLQAYKSIFGRDLLINRSLSEVKTSLQEYREWKKDSLNDPYISAIQELIRISQEHHLKSRFFVKAQISGEPDCTYDFDNPGVRHSLEKIRQAGMFIGLHGSFESYNQPERFNQEKSRLENLCQTTIDSCRQHFLRFTLQRDLRNYAIIRQDRQSTMEVHHRNTLQVWQAAGICHDYTLGYAEQAGFRCGTCHPYPLYDLDNDCLTNIIEHPLIVMDGSLFDYLQLNAEQSNVLISKLIKRCRAVEGDFIMLWHNHLLSRNYRQLYQDVYLHTLSSL